MRDFLEKASIAYYCGYPLISDSEFDALSKKYNVEEVGHKITDGTPHLFRMYSLQKVFSINDIPTPNSQYLCTPKLDGAAVSLTYVNGHLALGLTRGDGNIGRDITDRLELLVPNNLSFKGEIFITGEVVCPSTVTNARNVAAGSLNLKDLEEFKTRPLTFVLTMYKALNTTCTLRRFLSWPRRGLTLLIPSITKTILRMVWFTVSTLVNLSIKWDIQPTILEVLLLSKSRRRVYIQNCSMLCGK